MSGRYISDDLREAAEALRTLRKDERLGYLMATAADELDRLRGAPDGWKWRMVPDYPEGEVKGPCICGGWPGGECLKCAPLSPPHKG